MVLWFWRKRSDERIMLPRVVSTVARPCRQSASAVSTALDFIYGSESWGWGTGVRPMRVEDCGCPVNTHTVTLMSVWEVSQSAGVFLPLQNCCVQWNPCQMGSHIADQLQVNLFIVHIFVSACTGTLLASDQQWLVYQSERGRQL